MGRPKRKDIIMTPLHGRLNPRVAKVVYGMGYTVDNELEMLYDIARRKNNSPQVQKTTYADIYITECLKSPLYQHNRNKNTDPDYSCVLSIVETNYDAIRLDIETRRQVVFPHGEDFMEYLVDRIKQLLINSKSYDR